MIDQENGLPVGWVLLPIKSLGKTVTGNTPPTKELDNYGGDISFIKPSELVDQPVSAGRETISNKGAEKARIMPKGGVLVSCIGNLGKTAIAKRDVAFNQQINAILFNESVIPEYGFYYFQTANFRKDLESLASATTISIVNKSKFESISVPIAPPEQQQRIVAEIEKQFSRLDEAVAGLKRIQANLKRYRASVLKSAVEGKLTAEWRKQHPDTEPAEQLLQRILKERRTHWEKAELEKIQAAGKPPKDELWRHKYKEPEKPDMSGLPVLPDEWVWGKLQLLTLGVEYGTSAKSKEKGNCPVLRMGNIQNYKFDWSNLVYSVDKEEIEKYLLKINDVLFNRTNSPELVGKTAIFCGERPAIFAGYLIRVNQIQEIVEAKFLNYFLNSNTAKQYGNTVKTDGVNQSNINGTKLVNYPFPYCSLSEQTQIVLEVERRLSIADEVEQQINTNLKRAERLRQSILKKAFSGKLVPQDPDDEPADVLLEKIKQAQRA